jgi:hypothetical protein
MIFIRKQLLLPKQIFEQGDNPQWTGEVENNPVEIYYDDDISGRSAENQYAVFSDKGFHGWLGLGFSMTEILGAVKSEPSDYQKAYDEYED